MRITRLETLCLSRMHELDEQWVTGRARIVKADAAVVLIHTDEGLTGIGEASPYGWPLKIADWVDWLGRELVGADPVDPTIVPRPNGRSWAHDCAVGGIDCALWDLRARIAGVRVAELLKPGAPDRVRLYASGGVSYDWRHGPESLIAEALSYVERGFTAFKLRIGSEWTWDGVTVDRFLGLMGDVAAAVDGRMELMLDGNCRLTEEQALPIVIELDRLGFTWFEEPIPRDDFAAYARLNAAAAMPITGGECYTTLEQFRPYLEQGCVGIVQPDTSMCGITECLRVARMAHAYGVDLCPHSWHNGLMATQHAHMVAALPVPRVLELCMVQGPLQWALLADPPAIEEGWLLLPEGPGLGVALAPDLAARFPHVEGAYALQVER